MSAHRPTPATVILVPGLPLPNDGVVALAETRLPGAADFITKPWDNDELIRTLKDAIDRSQEVETLESIESTHIHKVVDQCHGNISRAAELLGITRQTLYAKLKR